MKKLIQNERNPVRHGSNRILRLEIIQEIIPMKKTVRYLKIFKKYIQKLYDMYLNKAKTNWKDSAINSEGSDADEEAVRRSSAQSREKYRWANNSLLLITHCCLVYIT